MVAQTKTPSQLFLRSNRLEENYQITLYMVHASHQVSWIKEDIEAQVKAQSFVYSLTSPVTKFLLGLLMNN